MTMIVTGYKELDKQFATMTDRMQRHAVRPAVSAGATVLVRAIRSNTPRGETGNLRKSIGKRAWSKGKKGIIGQVVGPRWPKGAHGWLVEMGHQIAGTDKFVPPHPFQRPAMDRSRAAVASRVRDKMRETIPRAVKKFTK